MPRTRRARRRPVPFFRARARRSTPLATHVCHAYVADRRGQPHALFGRRASRRGRPACPSWASLRARRLFECAVAVVRYFGGIKLGAGGLTRAYAACAAECLDGAELALWDECTCSLRVTVGLFRGATRSPRWLDGRGARFLRRDFAADRPALSVAVRARRDARRSAPNVGRSSRCGRAEDQRAKTRKYFAPFPLAQ